MTCNDDTDTQIPPAREETSEQVDPDKTVQEERNQGEDNPPRNLRDRSTVRLPQRFEANFVMHDEPTTYNQTINGPTEAIQEELNAHAVNGTWKIVDLPVGNP